MELRSKLGDDGVKGGYDGVKGGYGAAAALELPKWAIDGAVDGERPGAVESIASC